MSTAAVRRLPCLAVLLANREGIYQHDSRLAPLEHTFSRWRCVGRSKVRGLQEPRDNVTLENIFDLEDYG